jgi:hypothetical protein
MGDDGAGDDDTETAADGTTATESAGGSTAPFLFLLGLLGFVASLVAFAADLVTGHDILRSLAVNVGSVAVLVFWAARDTLTDPDSSVDSTGGAVGTGLLLLGLYLVVGAAVVGVTSLVHDRFSVVPWAVGVGLALVVVGFLVLPRERILSGTDEPAESETDTESEG